MQTEAGRIAQSIIRIGNVNETEEMKERDKYELFEDYLKGKLNTPEKAEFENLLQTDHEVLSQFEEYQAVHKLITDSALLDMKQQLADIHKAEVKSLRIKRNIQYAVVSALLITGLVLYVVLHKGNDTGKKAEPISPVNQAAVVKQTEESVGPGTNPGKRPVSATPQTVVAPTVPHKTELSVIDTVSKEVISSSSSAEKQMEPKTVQPQVLIEPGKKPEKTSSKPLEQKGVQESKPADCSNVQITCTYRIEEGCEDAGQGKIIFSKTSVKGGKPPYLFSVSDERFERSVVFDQLVAGRYKLVVKDDNDCLSVIGFADVREIVCPADFVISPERNEYWTIPYEKGQSGKLFIYTKNGNLVYSADIDQSRYTYWDGKASDGKELSLGVYAFRINYSNGKVLNGSVTIVK